MEQLLRSYAGRWHGTNKLWFMPDTPVFESHATAMIGMEARDAVASLRYEWSHDGRPHAGVMLVRDASGDAPPAIVWVDSFHTGGTFMLLGGGQRTAEHLTATGSYAAPTGPDWGWRIELHAESPAALLMRHYNILPDGQEALAIEVRFTRAAPPDAPIAPADAGGA